MIIFYSSQTAYFENQFKEFKQALSNLFFSWKKIEYILSFMVITFPRSIGSIQRIILSTADI